MSITGIRRNDDNGVDIDIDGQTVTCWEGGDSFGVTFSDGTPLEVDDSRFDLIWDTYAAFDAAQAARADSVDAVRAAAIYVATVRDDRDPEWVAMQIANHPDERADVALLESSLTA